MRSLRKCGIASTASALPNKTLTNYHLEKLVDTNNEWIVTRTGIKERRVTEKGKGASHLALEASQKVLQQADVLPEDLDLIVLATVTPDRLMPATANVVQARLGAAKAAALDVNAGCTGFVYGLVLGQQFIEAGTYDNVLVIGVDIMSRIIDWQDRTTCILFGDGAGAALLQPTEGGKGILSIQLGSDGNSADMLQVPAGGSLLPATQETVKERMHYIKMNGNEVFKFAVRMVPEVTLSLLKKAGKETSQLDYLFLHQANLRIMDAVRKRLGLSLETTPVNIERYGNMSAASIPVALDEVNQTGGLKSGDLIAIVGFGAGFAWGGVLMEW